MLLGINLPNSRDSCGRKSCVFPPAGSVKREGFIFRRGEMSSVRQEGNSANSSRMLMEC